MQKTTKPMKMIEHIWADRRETETSVIAIANQNEDKYHKEALWTRYKSKQKQVCYLNLR